MPDDYGMGDSAFSDFMSLPPPYTGSTETYQGNYRADPNSPLYGGPGMIDPSQGGGGGYPSRLSDAYPTSSPSGSSSLIYPAQPTGERGSAKSSYDNNFSITPMNFGGMPTPQGTPPTPARSGSFSGPNLPPAVQARLNALLTDPNAIKDDPAYKFALSQGEGALARTAAAKKMTLSGKSLTDATTFGQGTAMQYLNTLIQQLLGASNASRISQTGSVGADPGTQGEFAARDLIPVIQRLFSGNGASSPSMPMLPPSTYGGYTPRLSGALDGGTGFSPDYLTSLMVGQ